MKNKSMTYFERSRKLDTKATAVLLKRASVDFEAAESALKHVARLQLVVANRLRDCGLNLIDAGAPTGQHQVEWWQHHKSQLPAGCGFSAVKVCVHLAKKYDQPITDGQEALKEMQLAFEGLGVLEAPKRIGDQQQHDHNPWNEFVSRGIGFANFTRELQDEAPMSTWDRLKLEKFISVTEPVVAAYNAAKGLL